MTLHTMAYVSTASVDVTEQDVKKIVTDVRLKNALLDVSGTLLFNGVNFAQVLEGNHHVIGMLFEKISKDLRHTGLIKICDHAIPYRYFLNWDANFACRDLDMLSPGSSFYNAVTRACPPPTMKVVAMANQLKIQALEGLKAGSRFNPTSSVARATDFNPLHSPAAVTRLQN